MCQHHFSIAGKFYCPASPRTVRHPYPSHVPIVFGRDDNLGAGIKLPVPSPEFSTGLLKDYLIGVRALYGGLIPVRPELPTPQIPDITEGTTVVCRWIPPPPGHGKVVPSAIPGAAVVYHDMV